MARERNSPDPYSRDLADKGVQRPKQLDEKLQPDPTLAEGPSTGRGDALIAIIVAIILAAVFYGINASQAPTESSSNTTQSTSQNTAQTNASKPPAAGVRDVTPSGGQSGTTTGSSAPSNSIQPANPQSDNTPTPGATK